MFEWGLRQPRVFWWRKLRAQWQAQDNFSHCLPCLLFTLQVRYTCTRGSKDNVVLSVREFPTCNYVVVVSTPFLCKHPFFQPPVRPGVNFRT
jgi:hypothetical protein